MTLKSFRDLTVWQKAVSLTIECYRLTALLPSSERYGLASQLQRAAVSVAANIAEGHGRRGLGEYLRHLGIARASLMELETHVFIIHRLGFVGSQEADRLLASTDEVGRMLSGLIRSLEELRRKRDAQVKSPQHQTPNTCAVP